MRGTLRKFCNLAENSIFFLMGMAQRLLLYHNLFLSVSSQVKLKFDTSIAFKFKILNFISTFSEKKQFKLLLLQK